MMDEQQTQVAEAFSRKALVYDAFGEQHENLERMRGKVRQHVLRHLKSGDRILELNAGTGGDAVFFARQGYSVHATDLAPEMIAQIEAKRAAGGLQERLTVQQCSFTALDGVQNGPFNYVFSNMGGVNCIDDLTQITHSFGEVLLPGGYVTWVVMPRLCLWELAAALRGDWRTAIRRLRPGGVLASVEGVHFRTYYFTPSQVRRAFGPGYRLVMLEGLSVFTPPADYKGFAWHHPRLYAVLRALDERLAPRFPWRAWGDFFMITLQRLAK